MKDALTEPKAFADDHTRLSALVSGKVSLSVFFRDMHRMLKRRIGANNMYIALVENGEYLSFPYYEDEKEPENELDIYPMEGLTAAVIGSRRRLWLAEEPGLLGEVAYIGQTPADWLGVPVIDRAGVVSGALVVQSYDSGARFRQEDAEFVEFAAIQLSLALQFHAIDREIAVRRIASLVEETTDLETMYPGIHQIVAGLIPTAAKSFIIARIDRTAGLFRAVYCVDEKERFSRNGWPLDGGFSGFVASGTGQSFIFENGVTPEPEGYPLLGVQSAFWLGVPIRFGSVIMGVVITQTHDPEERITRDDERTLEDICPHIAHAIARTELFSSVRILKK